MFCGITFCKEMAKYKEVRDDIIQQQPKSQFPFSTKSIEKNEREKVLISICVMVIEYNCFFPPKKNLQRKNFTKYSCSISYKDANLKSKSLVLK